MRFDWQPNRGSMKLMKGIVVKGKKEINRFIRDIETVDDDGPMPPEEIARVLAAMGRMQPLEIADDVAAELDAWERTLNQHGIDDADRGAEDAFRFPPLPCP
jgi:hypothetical protein